MAKTTREPEVLVLGHHPCAYLAAALLRENPAPLRVVHSPVPGEAVVNRLVAINPAFFDLHKLFGGIKRKLELVPIYGVKFLADDEKIRSEWSERSIAAYVTHYAALHAATVKIAQQAGVDSIPADELEIDRLDEQAVYVRINGRALRPKLLLVAGHLTPQHKKLLGLPQQWDHGVLHRYTFALLRGEQWTAPSARKMLAMSLDLRGMLWWAWLLPGPGYTQIAVTQPVSTIQSHRPATLLRHWADVLRRHGELHAKVADADLLRAQSFDVPLAGALAQEGVANRTLLLGPAGGFYTACAEDIYPNCWSALFASEAAKKALREKHMQDGLGVYRQKWGATLGDFLRGPQQNLRFLLPLVYRNPTMTARLAEAILLGKSVVR